MDPALELLKAGNLDYLCFDFLAELTMALLQRQKLKNPQMGYVPDAVAYMNAMLPLARERGTRLISNGGGVNPRAAAERIAEGARKAGLQGTRVALVEGDDLLGKLDQLLAQGVPLVNMDTGAPISRPSATASSRRMSTPTAPASWKGWRVARMS
ncbi:acyclic terpene utilization AtuA family protein [Ottowia pentelensis]|uniref:acyclic terpene utilization AtuA family protein n=1 Tax=Ottowia pentelensis TaxID=511108 RepID=UPI003632C021